MNCAHRPTSVSLTINGPAPIILACFFNTAIDQQIEKFKVDNARQPTEDETQKIREWVLSSVLGTVQADILKEDLGQNTCIFSTEFALKMMGDIQEFFVHNDIGNFYSVSISGYHIDEAGANSFNMNHVSSLCGMGGEISTKPFAWADERLTFHAEFGVIGRTFADRRSLSTMSGAWRIHFIFGLHRCRTPIHAARSDDGFICSHQKTRARR